MAPNVRTPTIAPETPKLSRAFGLSEKTNDDVQTAMIYSCCICMFINMFGPTQSEAQLSWVAQQGRFGQGFPSHNSSPREQPRKALFGRVQVCPEQNVPANEGCRGASAAPTQLLRDAPRSVIRKLMTHLQGCSCGPIVATQVIAKQGARKHGQMNEDQSSCFAFHQSLLALLLGCSFCKPCSCLKPWQGH